MHSKVDIDKNIEAGSENVSCYELDTKDAPEIDRFTQLLRLYLLEDVLVKLELDTGNFVSRFIPNELY